MLTDTSDAFVGNFIARAVSGWYLKPIETSAVNGLKNARVYFTLVINLQCSVGYRPSVQRDIYQPITSTDRTYHRLTESLPDVNLLSVQR